MNERAREFLDREGYLFVENHVTKKALAAVRQRVDELLAAEGEQAGVEFKQEPQSRRLANLVNKGEVFQQIFGDAQILEYVGCVLGPRYKLSSLNFRAADAHSDWVQPLHCDMGAVADEQGYWVCNVIWLLDDFTAENGATRLVPGSHRRNLLPQDALADPLATHPEEILLVGPAGSVVVMNAHLWHGGTANRSARPRRALHSFYCRRDKPQQQYQKALLSPEVQQSIDLRLRDLLALDDPFNDQLSAAQSGASGFLK